LNIRTGKFLAIVCIALVSFYIWQNVPRLPSSQWSVDEQQILRSLWSGSMAPAPADPGNAVAENIDAARLGQRLFFDPGLSGSGNVACANCHRPDWLFSDRLPLGIGNAEGDRHTMGLIGVAYSPWLFWDGRKDSLWSQALEPLENPLEHAGNRLSLVRWLAADDNYRTAYEKLFGPMPDFSDPSRFPVAASPVLAGFMKDAWLSMNADDQYSVSRVFSNIGKAIAAYERQLLPGPARFDAYVDAVLGNGGTAQSTLLTGSEIAGLRLFIGKAQCINCHNGALFTNNAFHNTGVLSAPGQVPALGRSAGLRLALADPFNCQGKFSDAAADQCLELRFALGGDELLGAQRTASLRNVTLTAPYMHNGQLRTLPEVIEHYDLAKDAMLGHNEAKPLKLRAIERRQLESFLHSLEGAPETSAEWLVPPVDTQQ
jgi:cytochrome c peroxidase